MKFILFVEGATEKQGAVDLIRRWLNGRFGVDRIGVKPIDIKGVGNFLREVPNKARLHLSGPDAQKIVGAVGLADLYGANMIPGNVSTVEEMWQLGKERVEREVNHPRFKMFFAVHDVEAWLLSQPGPLNLQWGKELQDQLRQPEKINLNTPPAKLLSRLYRLQKRRKYGKTVDGNQLFRKLDPEVAYNKCPYLKEMLDEMLKLAKESGL